jgi:hypothetical protein
MSIETDGGWLFSLRIKLLAVLIPVMAISLWVAITELSLFLRSFFQRRAELEIARLGQAVQLALRQSMLRMPKLALGDILTDLQKTPSLRRVWINDKRGRVAVSGELLFCPRFLSIPCPATNCDAQSGRSLHPLNRHPGPVARTWRRPCHSLRSRFSFSR